MSTETSPQYLQAPFFNLESFPPTWLSLLLCSQKVAGSRLEEDAVEKFLDNPEGPGPTESKISLDWLRNNLLHPAGR